MKHIVDPLQTPLFNPFQGIIPPLGLKAIQNGWQGIFRHALLQLMPAHELGLHAHPTLGRPTKELYAVAGLLFLQETNDWTNEQAVEAALFRTDVQYALNLEPGRDELCLRTFERHRAIFIKGELAEDVMERVTSRFVTDLELNTDRQRLDSTHVFSNMARFGRTRLIGVAVKRFLAQVQRHHAGDYRALPEELRERYAPSTAKLFANTGKSPEDRARVLQRAAEDLHDLIVRFAEHEGLNHRPSYKALTTVFEQQCRLVESKVTIREKTGGACLQNPSDTDATYDGHKGPGYKAQLVETCSEENEVQLILTVLPQTASETDAAALQPILRDLKAKEMLPKAMLADTPYGGDENVQAAAAMGVELVSPVAGCAPEAASEAAPSEAAASDNGTSPAPAAAAAAEEPMEPLSIDDFAMDEPTGKVTACPAARVPLQVIYDAKAGTTTIEMPASDCDACPFRTACPIKKTAKGRYKLSYTDKQRRLEERRREEATPAFRERYAKRAGIESTNSGLKRRLGLGRLRVRGAAAVGHAIYLKVAGWNLLRVAASGKLGAKVKEAMAGRGLGGFLGLGDGLAACWARPTTARRGPIECVWGVPGVLAA